MSRVELPVSPAEAAPADGPRDRSALAAAAWIVAAALPLIGLGSLLWRRQLDLDWDNYRVHFTLFLTVGIAVFLLAYVAGEAANRRGDARVLLISLAFLSTGGFLSLHALGTEGVLFAGEHSGFKVANPVGLVIASLFAVASAFVDQRPSFAPFVVRHRVALRRAVLGAMAVWFVWTVADLPPLRKPGSEGGSHSVLATMAGVGAVAYAVAAARYWRVYRGRIALLQASIIACFILLAEAMIGVALTGERAWHASWWEWHGLIVTAYAVVCFAAQRQWHDERFRGLYLATTRERVQPVSVLFVDLAGFTAFTERAEPAEVVRLLDTFYGLAAPLDHAPLRRRRGEAHGRRADGDVQQPRRRARPRRAGGRRGAGAPARAVGGRGGPPRLAAARVGRQQRRRRRPRDGRRRVRRLRGRRGHRQHGVPAGGACPGGRCAHRAGDAPGAAGGQLVKAVPGLRVKGRQEAVDAFVLWALPGVA